MLGTLALLPILLGCLHEAWGQTFHMGKCPAPPVQEEFDVSKYLGKWYVIEKLLSNSEKSDCFQTNYSRKENGKFKVVNKELLSDGTINEAEGEAWQADPDQPAQLHIKFHWLLPAAPYKVISTDYNHYSLVYSCLPFLWVFHMDDAWILSRTPQLHPDTVEHLKDILQSYEIDTDGMRPTNQLNCPKDM
ncbi:apolipoprotein D [Heteronotia binoei]|uniref:apolipoprotein D n=1 Tax=Heteronotia binoei TaxID=13085 RepID=UPI00292FD82A|nr:apolipoprotein D [Heteronotia binoei]